MSRPDRSPSSGRVRRHRLHDSIECAGASGRADGHRRHRRLPQPRRRRRRPGCAARAGVSSRDLRSRRCDGRGPQSRRHRQPDACSGRTTRRSASTAGRPTPCSTSGANARRADAFDANGAAAARGVVDARLLDALLAEPYFALAPPKSTGLDLFNAQWLDARLDAADARARLRPEDVQATLAQLTADVVAASCRRHAAARRRVGGVRRRRLQRRSDGAARPGTRADGGRRERRARVARRPGRGDGVRLAGARLRRAAAGQRADARPAPPVRASSVRSTRPAEQRKHQTCPLRAAAPPRKKPPEGGFVSGLAATQAEKLEPQPQVVVAFGFLITNWAPCRSSL